MVGPIPDDVYDYDYNNYGVDDSVRVAEVFLEIGNFKNYWLYSDINDSEINKNFSQRILLLTTQEDLSKKQSRSLSF